MKPLSYSQISLYQSCPLHYKLRYVDGLKPKEKWYFSFGRTLHNCAEYFFKVSVPPPPSLDELLGYYERRWLSGGYESPDEEARYKEYGRDILTGFYHANRAVFRMPVAVEKLFFIDIGGVKLRGFIDRIDKLDSGGLSIIDYKTDKELFTRERLENNLQLTLYQMAAQDMWRLPVESLVLYHMRTNTPFKCEPRSEAELEEARNLVLEVAGNIAGQRFDAVENQYCPCDFPEHCPYYRHKGAPDAKEADVLHGSGIGEAVEQYVSLQSQIKELETQLDEIKQAVIDFCQAEGLNRVYGREHAITYKLVERMGVNEEDARALLEPEGLWPQVLSFDQSKLKQLITNESVAGEIRHKLEAMTHAIFSSPRLWLKKLDEEE